MLQVASPTGATVSYEKYGAGPPLVLVHGAFSDHHTNWEFVAPILQRHFTVHAIARRGRGQTPATRGHSLQEESLDVVALIAAIGAPVFLLGHSYGAQAALAAAARVPERVLKLVLYEPPWPGLVDEKTLGTLELLASERKWDALAETFFREVLSVPPEELRELRETPLWPPIGADAEASMGDLRALSRYDFRPDRFRHLVMPVMLQIGTESPRALYVTDALATSLPDASIHELAGQAHEGMTTAPSLYADAVTRFLLATDSAPKRVRPEPVTARARNSVAARS
jgi:pimeloyl-ACP methyl ester carboxylesterase